MTIFVKLRDNKLYLDDYVAKIRSGKAGLIDSHLGTEGDAKTPLGTYKLRFGLYRADRLPSPPPQNPDKPLAFWPLRPDDGWCDDPQSPLYNRFIRRPYNASHETLWREDGAYDIILVMSHNDSPPISGLGSAVFFHIAQSDDRKTLGCVALTPDDMSRLLPKLQCGMRVRLQA